MNIYDRVLQNTLTYEELKQPVIFSRYFDKKKNFFVPCEKLLTQIFDDKYISFENNIFIDSTNDMISFSLLDISEDYNLIEDVEDINDIALMLRNFDKKLEINEYDKLVLEKLFHIEEICRQPSYHLSREITKVSISRAKRIPVKSINYLAAHSEDWSRRRIKGVEPKKILSETIEYDLHIYENKVTAKLIDKLLAYCNKRLKKDIDVIENFEKKINQILKDIEITDDQKRFWYKKRNRDYLKISEIKIDTNQLEKLKIFILKIQYRLFSLLSTELYLENKNFLLSSDILDRTNLLDNHQHYRYASIVWNEYNKLNNKAALNCEELKSNNINIINAFIDYAFVLISHSILELKYNNNMRISKYEYLFSSDLYSFDIQVKKNEFFNIEVMIAEKKLTFIPLLLDEKTQLNISLNENIYCLTPTNSEINNFIKISPDDINSEERITKILFKYILNKYIEDYLFFMDSQFITQFNIIKNWFLENNEIIVNLSDQGKLQLYIKKYITQQEFKNFKYKIKEQKNNLPHYQTRDQQLIDLDKIELLLQKSKDHFRKYFICIGCGKEDQKSLIPNDKGFIYKCQNKDCGVTYGNHNDSVFYKVKNIKNIKNNFEDTIGYENIS